MKEYFIVSNSFAAPFFSDTSTGYQAAPHAEKALEVFAEEYKHPCGLFSANVYESADAYHKGEKRLAQWLCNQEIEMQKITAKMSGYSYLGHGVGKFRIDEKEYSVENPKDGRVVE